MPYRFLLKIVRFLNFRNNMPINGPLAAFAALFLYSTIGFKLLEQSSQTISWSSAAWWTIVTMTTVGYGDIFPVTFWGRVLVGYPTLILGVSLVGYLLSVIATFVMESKFNSRKGLTSLLLENHIIIINFTSVKKFMDLFNELKKDPKTSNRGIILIDEKLEEIPQELNKLGVKFVAGKPTELSILEKANFSKASYGIVLLNEGQEEISDLRNLAIVLTLKSENKSIKTVVECLNGEHIPFFKRAGCQGIICLSSMAGQIIAQEVQDPGVSKILTELTSNSTGKQIYLVKTPDTCGKYEDLKNLFKNESSMIIGIQKENGEHKILPSNALPLDSKDKAIVIADRRPHFS